MKNKRSAKDIAFDKERAKFRKEIRELEHRIYEKDKRIIEQDEILRKCNDKIWHQEELIQRLSEYTDLSKEEMRRRIENDRARDDMIDRLGEFGHIFRRFGVL